MSTFFHLGPNKIRCRDVSVICNPQKVTGGTRWCIQVLMSCGVAYQADYADEATTIAVHAKLVEACEESGGE